MLDNQTLLLLTALLFLLLPALVWWVTFGVRTAAVGWWCLGSTLAGLGILLMGLRPWIPTWATFHVANTGLIMSLACWAQSLRTSLARPWSQEVMLLWALAALVYYSCLFTALDATPRGMGVRLVLGGFALYTAALAVDLAKRLSSHNAAAIALAYFVLGAVLLLQSLLLGTGAYDPNPFSNTWDASILATVTLATSAVGHFCYAGMILDQSTQAQIKAFQTKVAAEETARLDAQLGLLDRQRRMVMATGSLAHELDQPLTAALTLMQTARRQVQKGLDDGTRMADLLGKTVNSILRAGKVLDRIRSMEQAQPMQRQRLDLRALCQSALALMEVEWRRLAVQIKMNPGDKPLWFLGDEVAIVQVLVNLLRNATQAIESRPVRSLQIDCLSTPDGVQIRIRDSGAGVSPEILATWGEPFVSTREHGLGLGLAISRDIVAQHLGQLALRNLPQGGAEAILTLPAARESEAVAC